MKVDTTICHPLFPSTPENGGGERREWYLRNSNTYKIPYKATSTQNLLTCVTQVFCVPEEVIFEKVGVRLFASLYQRSDVTEAILYVYRQDLH